MDKQTFYEELKRKEKQKVEIIVFIALFICLGVVLFLVLNNKDTEYVLEQTYIIGNYECSQEVFMAGEALKPDKTEVQELSSKLDSARLTVDLASFQIEEEGGEEAYNQAVLTYNSLKEGYLNLEEEYNQKVEDYNNYIKANCAEREAD